MQMLIAGERDYIVLLLFFFPEKRPRWKGNRKAYSLVNAATFRSINARGVYWRGNKFIHSAEAFEKA